MKLNRNTLVWAWITVSSLFSTLGVTLNEGSTTSGLVQLFNENGADIANLTLASGDKEGEKVVLATQINGGDQEFAVRSVWYPNFLNLTGAVYSVQADFQPSSSAASQQVDQLGGVMGWLNLETKTGLAWYVQPGDTFFDPAFQLRVVRFEADNGFDNENVEGLFNLDGTPATFTIGSANAEVGSYHPNLPATFLLAFSAPTAGDLTALPEATSRIQASVYQGTDGEGNPIQIGSSLELLTTLPVPEPLVHKAGYFGYYGNIFARGTQQVGYFDNLIADGEVGAVNLPPAVQITAPQNGLELSAPADLVITANAADGDGLVVLVEFTVNGVSLGADAEAPYAVQWSESVPGEYSIRATAIDDQGATGISSDVTVTIIRAPNQSPAVAITFPTEGAVLSDAEPITIQTSASDPDGMIERIEFFDGGILVGSDTTEPFELENTFFRLPGPHRVRAVAFDNEGAFTESVPVNYTVARNLPPTVNLLFPADGSEFVAPATLALQASASDTDGSIVKVEFLLNGAVVATVTQAPYSAVIEGLEAGAYTIRALATDNFGSSSNTQQFSFTVRQNQLPGIVIQSPGNETTFDFGQELSLEVLTNDADGEVVRVDFFDNGQWVGSASESPFTLHYTPNLPGNHTLTAVAFDNDGGTTESAGITFTVEAPPVSEAPALNFGIVDGQLEVSWDSAYLGSVLETSEELPGNWMDVTGSNQSNSARFPLDEPRRYFRLRAVITLPPPSGDAPVIAFGRSNNGSPVLSWDTASAVGYQLQYAEGIGSEWVPVEVPTPGSYTVDAETNQGFFRLVRP